MLTDWLVCFAELVSGRVCFCGFGFRGKVCLFHWPFFKRWALVSGPVNYFQSQDQCMFLLLWFQDQGVLLWTETGVVSPRKRYAVHCGPPSEC